MAWTEKAEKISITLPPDMLREIRELVKAGHYASTSEVIREAMRLWKRQEEEHKARLAAIRDRLDQSAKSGAALPLDDAFRELERHHRERMNSRNEKL